MGYLTGAGSDYAAFVHYLGISSIDMSYTYDKVGKERLARCITTCRIKCRAVDG